MHIHSPKVSRILALGEDMTKSQIKYLYSRYIETEEIAAALNMNVNDFRKMWKKWTGTVAKKRKEEDKQLSVELYKKLNKEGWSDRRIAAYVSMSPSFIAHWKAKNGLREQPIIKLPLTVQGYLEDKKRGLKDKDIANRLNCSSKTLVDWKMQNLTEEQLEECRMRKGRKMKAYA